MFTKIRPRLLATPVPLIKQGTQQYTVPTTSESTLVQAPQYPPIHNLHFKARRRAEQDAWAAKIKRITSVEGKLIGINLPRYYGWKCAILEEGRVPYNCLEHAQYITRTHVMNDLPAYYNAIISSDEVDSITQEIRSHVQDVIAFEYSSRKRRKELNKETLKETRIAENIIANAIASQVNRVLLTHLSSKFPELLEVEIDFDPRIEAFWLTGGIDPPECTRRSRASLSYLKEYVDDPVDTYFQYTGQPILQLRHKFPLQNIMTTEECQNTDLVIPEYKYDPRAIGYYFKRRHGTSIPGFWPGDRSEFGLLSYHNCGYLHDRQQDDQLEALSTQAIFASYSWLHAQACYQGFSTFNDITYPLVSQMVTTNGQLWSFYVYQLNTMLFYAEHATNNPKRNICWVTEPMKLFDKIENETVHGFNDEVLRNLIKLYANIPYERVGVEMQPYLGEVKRVANFYGPKKKVWMENHFKHLVTNRPRHRRIPEIYHWQKIYLIDHKRRPLEKRREPFQFGINPFRRPLNDVPPPYVPRCLRAKPNKRKIDRFEQNYYPY